MNKYRIIEKQYADYSVYVLEQEVMGIWESRFAHRDLEIIREAKLKKERASTPLSEKVIE